MIWPLLFSPAFPATRPFIDYALATVAFSSGLHKSKSVPAVELLHLHKAFLCLKHSSPGFHKAAPSCHQGFSFLEYDFLSESKLTIHVYHITF